LALDIFRLTGRVILNTAEAMTGLRKVENAVTRTGEVFKTVGTNVTNAGRSLTHFVTIPIITGIAGAIKQASDMNETISKTQVVFKESADAVLKWSDHTLKSVGLAKGTALDMVSAYGDMGTAMGLNVKQSKDMAISLVELTGDMASFKNMRPDEVHLALTGAYTGETEALKRLGIVMTVANLERFAETQGIKKEYKEMTQAEKIRLRYNYIMKASKNSIGDFKRTQQSAANQMRLFTEGIKEAGAQFGTLLLPYFTKAISIVNKVLEKFRGMPPVMQKITFVIALLVAAIGPLLMAIGTAITVFGTLAIIIGTIGLPITIAIALIIPLIAALGGLGVVAVTMAYKMGILKKSFDFLKNGIDVLKFAIKGDFNKTLEILTQKMGLSKKQAGEFNVKLFQAKLAIQKVIEVARNVANLIKAIFSDDKKKVIDLLIKKFGLSKKEAKDFWQEVKKLKAEILVLAKKLKDDAGKAIIKFIDKIKDASKFVIDHRKEIAKVIEIVISFAATFVKKIQQAYATAKFFVKIGTMAYNAMKKAQNAVTNAMTVIMAKITGLKAKVWQWGYNILKGLANGIKAAYGLLRDAAGGAAAIISAFLGHHSPTKEGPGRFSDKWGPNLMAMLAKTMLSKRNLLKDAVSKIADDINISKLAMIDVSIPSKTNYDNISKAGPTIQIINPKFFNQDDVNKMMEPVIQRLDFLGYRSR
jgi:polyhydroxyalkanoate synthesis regulator phasin